MTLQDTGHQCVSTGASLVCVVTAASVYECKEKVKMTMKAYTN